SGTLFPLQEVVRPNGTTRCFSSGCTDQRCPIDATGTHTIIVADSGGTNTGDYSIAIQRLNSPTGCTALTFGALPKKGTIGVAGVMDCFTFSGIGGHQIRVLVVTTSGTLSPHQDVVRPNATSSCRTTATTHPT